MLLRRHPRIFGAAGRGLARRFRRCLSAEPYDLAYSAPSSSFYNVAASAEEELPVDVLGRPVQLYYPRCAEVAAGSGSGARSWHDVLSSGAPDRLSAAEVDQWRQEVS